MADRYGTIAGYKVYHLARGHDIAVSEDDDIEAALLVASEWLDARFRSSYGGRKQGGRDQVREWGRVGAVDINGNRIIDDAVPWEVENATYEAAAITLATPGALSVNFTPGKYQSVSIDGAVSVVYASIQTLADAQAQFAIVNETLAPVLTGSGGSGNSLVGESVRW